MADVQPMKARSASTRQPMQRHITAAANYCSVLFSFLVSFIYLCKVTKNREQNKRNSFLFYAEMQQLRQLMTKFAKMQQLRDVVAKIRKSF